MGVLKIASCVHWAKGKNCAGNCGGVALAGKAARNAHLRLSFWGSRAGVACFLWLLQHLGCQAPWLFG